MLRTDGRTDRQTDLLYHYHASVCSRVIKMKTFSVLGWRCPQLLDAQFFLLQLCQFPGLGTGSEYAILHILTLSYVVIITT